MRRMYKVNEIFYSLQGEGYWTGTPMVFVRLSGCNLQCPWCDTAHQSGTMMSADEIVAAVNRANTGGTTRVCITGGEPLLQLDKALVNALNRAGYLIHVETNGTRRLPAFVTWVTLSPKGSGNVIIDMDDVMEVKLVYEGGDPDLSRWESESTLFLQPCDTGDAARNRELTAQAAEYVKRHPKWRLSLQTHKLIDIK